MAAKIESSLQRLRRSCIDCLALHGVNTQEHLDWIRDPDGCMAAIWEAQAAGKIRFVGFSSHGSLEGILAALDAQPFDFVNLHYYFLNQRNQPVIRAAQELDLGVFIISPADKGGQLYRPSEELRALCAPFDPLALTYRWLLGDGRITTLSAGPATAAELDSLIPVLDHGGPLSQAESAAIARLGEQLDAALGPEQCHQCYQCLPCPEAIHIPEVLRLRNLAIAYGMGEFGQYRYRMFENAGHWFPGVKANRCTDCGDCLPRCPHHLPIPDLLRDTHHRLKGPGRRRLWG